MSYYHAESSENSSLLSLKHDIKYSGFFVTTRIASLNSAGHCNKKNQAHNELIAVIDKGNPFAKNFRADKVEINSSKTINLMIISESDFGRTCIVYTSFMPTKEKAYQLKLLGEFFYNSPQRCQVELLSKKINENEYVEDKLSYVDVCHY